MSDMLREAIRFCLTEDVDVIAYANRLASKVPLVFMDYGQRQKLVALSSTDTVEAEEDIDWCDHPKVIGMVEVRLKKEGICEVQMFFADSPQAAVTLLAASLEKWRYLVPDTEVSPAAQQVIKRYFNKHRGNPNKISSLTDEVPYDFLEAVYVGPVGFDLQAALKAGANVVQECLPRNATPDDVENMRKQLDFSSDYAFGEAYYNPKKTKVTYDHLLKSKRFSGLFDVLTTDVRSHRDSVADKAVDWIRKNQEAVQKHTNDSMFASQRRMWSYLKTKANIPLSDAEREDR